MVEEDARWLNYTLTPEKDMEFIGRRYTVCEILREIYKKTDDPFIKEKCRLATSLSKSMAARITKYEGRRWGKSQYVWNSNKNHQRGENEV